MKKELDSAVEQQELETASHKAAKDSNIFDDPFARIFFDDEKVIKKVLEMLTENKDIEIDHYAIQKPIENLPKHSIVLDVFVRDKKRNIYNLELQKASSGADKKRIRYYSGLSESEGLEKGEEYKELQENWTIFITEKDIFKAGAPIYHIDKYVRETKEPYIDDSHILYVNGSYTDRSSPIGNFIADLVATNPEEVTDPVLKKAMLDIKEETKGEIELSEAILTHFGPILQKAEEANFLKGKEEGITIGTARGIEKQITLAVLNGFDEGYSIQSIAKVNGISTEKVKAILQKENRLV